MTTIQTVLATDIDNTLTGDDEALINLGKQLQLLREQRQLCLFLTTGRTLEEILTGFEQEHLPQADAIVAQVGTEIYLPPFRAGMKPLAAWEARLKRQFERTKAMEFVKAIDGAELQAAHYNTNLKVSYTLTDAPQPEQAATLVKQRVAQAENGDYRVVWSSGEDLDILPAAAGKRNAIRFLLERLDLSPQQIITAGDSGNDRSMLLEFDYGIIVANAQPELQKLRETQPDSRLYFAEEEFAAGVAEGLRHFGVLNTSRRLN